MLDITEQLERYGEAVEKVIPESIAMRPPEPVTTPTELSRRAPRVAVMAAAVAVILVLVVGLVAALRITDEPVSVNEPAGPPSGAPVAHLRIEALPSLSYQATEFTTIAGINEIEFVDKGSTDSLVFDDPSLAHFELAVPTGPTVGKVRLEPGRDYRIGSSIAGRRAAGMEAVIRVLPARFAHGRGRSELLRVPPRRSVKPARMRDGAPVFVVRHDDGSVDVFSAVSTHRPYGFESTVGWCGRARWFQDAYYGSAWDEYGRKVGGPTPTDLDEFESRLVENGTKVAVGGLLPATERTEGSAPTGETCVGTEAGSGDFAPGPMQLIPFREGSARSLSAVIGESSGRLRPVLEITVLMAPGERTRACVGFKQSRPFRCAGPTVQGFDDSRFEGCSPVDAAWAAITGPALVRIDSDTVEEVIFVRSVKTSKEPPNPCISLLPSSPTPLG